MDSHIHCVKWLVDYFDICDKSPTSRCTMVNMSEKEEVYKLYYNQTLPLTKTDDSIELVSVPTFNSLWAKLFPHCIKRRHGDILGKCSTCYDIDNIRKSNEGNVIQEMCKKAHAIHRGGLFMKERMR